MSFFDTYLQSFGAVFSPENLLACLLGALIGMVVGVLPGLGPVATISVLLPVTFTMEPVAAIIMLAGIYYGAQYGGTITAVLLKLPGEDTAVITAIDGYQMARRGRASAALGIAAVGSFIGGTVSIVGLTLLAPMIAGVALMLGPPEYSVIALLGILLVVTVSSGSTIKALISAGFGLVIATVGLDLFTGAPRLTGGTLELGDGFDFAALAMGLFGVAEILHSLERGWKKSTRMPRIRAAYITMKDWIEARWAIARGSLVGFAMGLIPGGGATLGALLSYAVEKRVAKNPSKFGHGAIQGVAAPETANNAAATSAFIPLLTLGIPANVVLAVLYGALLIQGITPSPKMITEHPDMFWGVINSMWVGNIILLLLSLPLVGLFVRLVRIREGLLLSVTLAVVLIGAFSIANSMFNVWIVLISGVVGYLMKKFGFEPAPLILALILGDILERSVRQSLILFQGDLSGFLHQPIAMGILMTAVVVVVALVVLKTVTKRRLIAGAVRDSSEEWKE